MKKIGLILVLAFVSFILFSSQAEAKTAVTISVEAGPAFTEGNLETVDLIVPERPAEAMPLQVGDKVFFEAIEPLVEGEGTIIAIYETDETTTVNESTIKEAIIIDHILY